MARRNDHSRAELYALALGAAREIAEAEGLRGLTARRIASRIGYSVGTLYNVFVNLDDLIVHLNGSTLDQLHQTLGQGRRSSAPEADLRVLLAAYVRFTHERRNLWNLLFEYHLPEGQGLPDWYTAKIGNLMALVEDALAPLFRVDQAAERHRSARVLWSAVHGICTLSGAGRLGVVGAESADRMTEALLSTYLAGLRAQRSETP